jgi:putative ABC transport system substrate-binding protein
MSVDRRLCLLRGAAMMLPFATAWSQARAIVRRVGVLAESADYERMDEWKAFADEMARRGHVAGRNVEYLHRNAGTNAEPELSRRLQQAAAELVQRKIDVLYLAEGDVGLRAVRPVVSPIPIVVDRFYFDPVERGHVASLSRPGANVTGNAVLYAQHEAKGIELLVQALGMGTKLAVIDPSHLRTLPLYPQVQAVRREVAHALRVTLVDGWVDRVEDLAPLLAQLKRDGVRAAKFDDPIFFIDRRAEVAAAFTAARLPALSFEPAYVKLGLLLALGWDVEEIARRSAGYVDRILRGQRPQDLPVEQVSKFKVAVNLATARAIGVKIPASVLARADEVIE